MSYHRWSGWPGAWCLDCGQEDQNEICIGTHAPLLACIHGHELCMDRAHPPGFCDEHVNGPCLHPGEMLADPYARNAMRRMFLRVLFLRLTSP